MFLRRVSVLLLIGLIVLAARGTSDNAATYAKYLFEIVCGVPVACGAQALNTMAAMIGNPIAIAILLWLSIYSPPNVQTADR